MRGITVTSSLEDVCFAVCTALQRVETIAVLSGGSAATCYAPDAYQSRDADFIIHFSADRRKAGDAMHALGYRELGGTYHHSESAFTVEFPPGPLSVGGTLVRSYETRHRDDEILHLLSRTDCVRDRLTAFYYFADRSALTAAVGVARSGPIDLSTIERWSRHEGEAVRFGEFRDAVGS